MGMIIEKYIGKTGRKLFMLFCWLFTLLVIAAFTDMVAGTFVGTGLEDAGVAYANGSAASISMLFILVAVIFGLIQKKVGKMNEWVKAVVAIGLLVVMFAVGMKLPIYASKTTWIYIIMAYLFLASVMPMWLLMQPRDYMTTFMLLGMIIGAVLGVVVAHPDMELNAFNGFQVGNSSLFPTLFVTIACGAVSGFHSLVSSGTSSKTISNEKDMPMVGYGAMIVESLLGVVALVVVGAVAVNGTKPDGTPFSIFSSGCCRIPGENGGSRNRGNRIHDHVCIRTGTDFPGFRRKNRTDVLPGAVLRGYHRHCKDDSHAEGSDQ